MTYRFGDKGFPPWLAQVGANLARIKYDKGDRLTKVTNWLGMSMCETCRNGREVRTARSRFLLCELSASLIHYSKYPPQPVIRCDGYVQSDEAGDLGASPQTEK